MCSMENSLKFTRMPSGALGFPLAPLGLRLALMFFHYREFELRTMSPIQF
jgi:hypothetical protein